MNLSGSLSRCFAIIVLLLAALWSSGSYAKEMVSVNRNEINMRSGPGTQHDVLWALSRGYPLQVVRKKGNWLEVRDFEKDSGWVYAPLVSKKAYSIVNVNTANVRSSPSTSSRIVATAERGEVLRTLSRKNGWVKIERHGGTKGWISQRLLWGW